MSKGYDFDPTNEPATVQIEVNPRRYVKINDKLLHIQNRDAGEESRMWVPPRVANDLTMQSTMDVSKGIPPVARMIGTRPVELATAEAEAEAPTEASVREVTKVMRKK